MSSRWARASDSPPVYEAGRGGVLLNEGGGAVQQLRDACFVLENYELAC